VIDVLLWYLILTLLGLLTFPLAYRLLPALPDRGYALARSLGLLIWAYLLWLLASLGMLYNNLGGILAALALLAALSAVTLRGGGLVELRTWLGAKIRLVLGIEVLFLVAFGGMALVRAANPEILGTEKPMELAFINAILNSPSFPPHDPWLSGYAISYYYFGYAMVAILAKLAGTPGSVAFNLGLTSIFALSALGAFGLVYNLLARFEGAWRIAQAGLLALFGPLFVLIVSNLGGLLEVLHARGLFWRPDGAGGLDSPFWSWLAIKDLNLPPEGPLSWVPTRYYWWWRASRVVVDTRLDGEIPEVIDEFPFFSYLLGDLHPHVLAMPFAFLAMGLALNLFFGGHGGSLQLSRWRLKLGLPTLGLGALVLGGMAFLNTWDFPVYVAFFAGAYVLRQAQLQGWHWGRLGEFLGLSLLLGLLGAVLYLPFYAGFASQAGGILPNLINPTRGAHLWVMFGTLFVPIFAYLIYLRREWPARPDFRFGLLTSLAFMLVLLVLAILLGFLISLIPAVGGVYLNSLRAASLAEAVGAAILRRAAHAGGWLTLALLLTAVVACYRALHPEARVRAQSGDELQQTDPFGMTSAHGFALLLILFGSLLVVFPEFFFLRDQFGGRMNTVFKFFYQAWLFLGVAAGFGTALLLTRLKGLAGWSFNLVLFLVLFTGLLYPYFGLQTKTNRFQPPGGFTLDGAAYYARQNPAEMDAIYWLSNAPPGVVAEAVGPAYSAYTRVATHSGQPNVLGWVNHQLQWRGGTREIGSREQDLERLYCTGDWNEANAVLRHYGVRYVFVGTLEVIRYQPNDSTCPRGLVLDKFDRFLPVVLESGNIKIYQVP
jgi:YYY domain-containing protein